MKILCICLLIMYVCSIAYLPNEALADSLGPEITDIYWVPKYPIYGDDVTVYATITDPDGVNGSLLYYCSGSSCYFPMDMNRTGNNRWYGTILWRDGEWENGTVIDFDITAKDNSSNTNMTDKIYFFFVSEIDLSTEMVDTTYVGETIWINGTALYNGNETAPVEYSNVTVKIVGTSNEYYSKTDGNGNFSMELVFESPGEYQINVTVTNRTLKAYSEESVMVIGISYFSLEVQMTTCYPDQQIWVNGTLRLNTEDTVANWDVEIRINDTLVSTTKTDSTGNYSVLITAPEELGQYIVNVTVFNSSLMGYNETSISVTEKPLPDLVISAEDITFVYTYSSPVIDEEVNITVTVHNLGSADCLDITVYFYEGLPNSSNLIGSDTITQISVGNAETCNVTWIAINGTHDIWVVVDQTDTIIESFEDNNNASKTIFVDDDFDDDGIGNEADPDDDNDNYNDAVDAFPYDPTEWVDTDSDGIGNNADTDDDDDGLLDTEEDLNGNGIFDSGETDPLNPDTDGDGVNDREDYDPLDPNVTEEPKEQSSIPWVLIALLVPIVIIVVVFAALFIFRKRKGKN
ncbi:MAG: CARDB domain-containing protein, partial [Thermoplasmata archaeon]